MKRIIFIAALWAAAPALAVTSGLKAPAAGGKATTSQSSGICVGLCKTSSTGNTKKIHGSAQPNAGIVVQGD